MSKLGVVIIGRNEGERLVRCIRSVIGAAGAVVYVDSGSTDRSVESARELGVRNGPARYHPSLHGRPRAERRVTPPDRAAPGRRVRAVRGRGLRSGLVGPSWREQLAEFESHSDAAVVCGRRRERYPERSVYNHLCDMEWNTPVGEAAACGGDALMRTVPLQQVGGYRDSLIAGEEPELCARLRGAGWKVFRVDAEMTTHDAAMTRFGQWWRRTVRAGYAYAEVSRLRRAEPDRHWSRQFRSNWVWGLLVPLAALAAAPFFPAALLVALAAYIVLGFRVYRHRRRRGDPPAHARLYTAFTVLSKFSMVLGQARYYRNRLFGTRQALIEYKSADRSAPVRVAYLVNQYPHVSHSFIRREIRAAEEYGLDVFRVSVRRSSTPLVDPADREEEQPHPVPARPRSDRPGYGLRSNGRCAADPVAPSGGRRLALRPALRALPEIAGVPGRGVPSGAVAPARTSDPLTRSLRDQLGGRRGSDPCTRRPAVQFYRSWADGIRSPGSPVPRGQDRAPRT